MASQKLRIIPLGGLGEVGKNMTVFEYGRNILIVDSGVMFPENDMLGVDFIIPDFGYLQDKKDLVRGIIATHGHEDHVGALAYFLREVNVPVYGTPLTVRFARSRVEELGLTPTMHAVEPREWVETGPFRFALVHVAHSVPHAAGVAFDTPEGIIVHSGDFKLDPTPIDSKPTDLGTFAGFARRGVRLLMCDSTNAEREGFVPSESSVGPPLKDLVARIGSIFFTVKLDFFREHRTK